MHVRAILAFLYKLDVLLLIGRNFSLKSRVAAKSLEKDLLMMGFLYDSGSKK